MGFEIERKWKPEALPVGMEAFPSALYVQGYLCRKPVLRIRKEGENYVFTYKGEGLKIREEYNLPLTKEAFQSLLPKCEGKIIEKTRYRIPLVGEAIGIGEKETEEKGSSERGLTAELDVFHGFLEGLLLLEVEFENEEAADAFQAPDWFGTEVTGDPAYSNAALSR